MGLGIGRKFKKLHKKMSILDKAGIGVDSKGRPSAKLFLDPAGVFTGEADAFHQKLGIGVRAPKIGGLGTDPEGERIAAEAQASQQAVRMTSIKRRLRRASMLSAAGSTKDKPAPQLSSVLAYGKTKMGE